MKRCVSVDARTVQPILEPWHRAKSRDDATYLLIAAISPRPLQRVPRPLRPRHGRDERAAPIEDDSPKAHDGSTPPRPTAISASNADCSGGLTTLRTCAAEMAVRCEQIARILTTATAPGSHAPLGASSSIEPGWWCSPGAHRGGLQYWRWRAGRQEGLMGQDRPAWR